MTSESIKQRSRDPKGQETEKMPFCVALLLVLQPNAEYLKPEWWVIVERYGANNEFPQFDMKRLKMTLATLLKICTYWE